MSFLRKILGKDDQGESGPAPECTHASLVAHWARPEDMGKDDLASSWMCNSCGEEFGSDERELFQAAEAERVRGYQDEKTDMEAMVAAEPKVI